MTDVMVSIRLPSSLLVELRVLAKKHHYMDISEAIRGILRKKWAEYSDPYGYELRQIRKSISKELKQAIMKKSEQRITEELKKMRERIRNEP